MSRTDRQTHCPTVRRIQRWDLRISATDLPEVRSSYDDHPHGNALIESRVEVFRSFVKSCRVSCSRLSIASWCASMGLADRSAAGIRRVNYTGVVADESPAVTVISRTITDEPYTSMRVVRCRRASSTDRHFCNQGNSMVTKAIHAVTMQGSVNQSTD